MTDRIHRLVDISISTIFVLAVGGMLYAASTPTTHLTPSRQLVIIGPAGDSTRLVVESCNIYDHHVEFVDSLGRSSAILPAATHTAICRNTP